MDLRHLRHFLAVAKTLNYTKAAADLNISASPLSRSIQQLERIVGGPLFARGTRKVELTPLGQALIPHATKVLEDTDDLTRDMKRRVQGYVELYVGMRSVPPELTRSLIHQVIRAVEPTAEVRLQPLDSFIQLDQIVHGKLSLGLVNRRSEDKRIQYLPVLREASGIALPDEPRFAELTEIQATDLTGLRLLIQPGADLNAPQLEPFLKAAAEVVPVNSDIVGGISTIIGQGGACCLTIANPSAPWHRYLAGEGVIVRPIKSGWEPATTYLCWRSDRDNEHDLGPIIDLARTIYRSPLEL